MSDKKIPCPIHSRILVKPDVKEQTSEGGIYIPDTAVQAPTSGKVVSIGKQVQDIKVGDHVKFGMNSGSSLEFGGQQYLIMEEMEVLVIY